MNFFKSYEERIKLHLEAMASSGFLPENLDLSHVSVEPPRDATHGDVATNAALVLSKAAGRNPREIAEKLGSALEIDEEVASVEIAGPGFINLRLADSFWHRQVLEVLKSGTDYGNSDLGGGEKLNVEYVSVNPTGPLHVGHARVAVVGDALAALLEKAGYDVTREYYYNDAGGQIDALARSVHMRYRELFGQDIGEMPEGHYQGDYIIDVAENIKAVDADKWLDLEEQEWLEPFREKSVAAMMEIVREDLDLLGVHQDVFFSEGSLHSGGQIQDAITKLNDKGYIYEGVLDPPKGKIIEDWEPRQQLLFKATEFGDDVDRPLQKSDKSWTYFAADIAYHVSKLERGFSHMINVWGADHGGHVKRLTAAVAALSGGAADIDVKLCQMVRLLRDGELVKMSKRTADFVTLKDIIEEVGRDVVRFIMLTRKNDAQLDFDFTSVVEQSRDNPVFYVQYAHARCQSVLRNAEAETQGIASKLEDVELSTLKRLGAPEEVALIRKIAAWPRAIESAAQAHEPHRIAFYLQELASEFHGLWNRGNEDESLRFIQVNDEELTRARLALIRAVSIVVASGLQVMGVEPVNEMR